MTTPIEDYALIGDTETGALVSRGGSIDWLCLPRFDSPACFAALLGTPEHGRWLIGPAGAATSTRSYRGSSYILETVHETDGGAVRVTDVMPVGDGRADVIRRVEGLRGSVDMVHEWVVRMGYGKILPWVARRPGPDGEDVITAVAGPDMVVLSGRPPPRRRGRRRTGTSSPSPRARSSASPSPWSPSWRTVPPALDGASRIEHSQDVFTRVGGGLQYEGPYRDEVVRSLLVLRQLTDSERGGIVAAATTSLPEDPGGSAELGLPLQLAARRLPDPATRSSAPATSTRPGCGGTGWSARSPVTPRTSRSCMPSTAAASSRSASSTTCPGMPASRPVRIGNGAVQPAAGRRHRRGDGRARRGPRARRRRVPRLVERPAGPPATTSRRRGTSRTAGCGRCGGRRTTSPSPAVMAWAAFDRAVRAVEEHGLDGPVERWRELRDRIHATVLDRGYDPERQHLHPARRDDRGGRVAAHDPARRVPPR